MQKIIFTFFVLVSLGMQLLFAQTPRDARVVENLTKLGFKYDVKDDGSFLFTIPVGSRTQMVFINSSTSQFNQMEIREVYSVIYQSNQKPNEAQLSQLLLDNSQKKLGAWEMISDNNQFFLVFTAKVIASQNEADLRSTIDIVANAADAMEQLLFSADTW